MAARGRRSAAERARRVGRRLWLGSHRRQLARGAIRIKLTTFPFLDSWGGPYDNTPVGSVSCWLSEIL